MPAARRFASQQRRLGAGVLAGIVESKQISYDREASKNKTGAGPRDEYRTRSGERRPVR